MADRNAKPFTLFIFCLIFSIMVITQIIIKNKYEDLLKNELADFADTYISYTEMIDEKICYYLNTYLAFESAPDDAYQKMIDATTASITEIDATFVIFEDGKTLWSSSKDANFNINSINLKDIVKDTNDTVGICKHYMDDGYIYYSKRLYGQSDQVGVICFRVAYDQIVDMLDEVYEKTSWLDVIIKNKNGKIIYQTNDRLENEIDDGISELFEKHDASINEGNIDIIFETKTSQKTSNKEKIGKYNLEFGTSELEKEIARRNGLISATSIGENLQISITAFSSLEDIDPHYYTRFIIMLFTLAAILVLHLIAGFYIEDKSMYKEFIFCLVMFIIIFFIHFMLEVGFLNNIYENELDYYSKLISKITDYDMEWTGYFNETVGDTFTIQDYIVQDSNFDLEMLNKIGKQVIVENESITALAILENGEVIYTYPQDFDVSTYSKEIKNSQNLSVQKTYYDKTTNLGIVLSKINFKYNKDAVLLCEYKVNDGSVLIDNPKFDVFGFRDAYGDSKLLNLKTDEAVDAFVEKVTFDDTTDYMTGIKHYDGKLYGYIIIPNSSKNINVFRYELENLYNYLVICFIIAMLFIVLITYFSQKVFSGRTRKKAIQKDDTIYEKLIEKIDQDIGDYGDDMID